MKGEMKGGRGGARPCIIEQTEWSFRDNVKVELGTTFPSLTPSLSPPADYTSFIQVGG